MRWHILIMLIVTCSFVGCRGTRQRDVWQSVLDAEKRALEDRAYDLEGEVASLNDQLASTRRENDALRKELEKEAPPSRLQRPQLRGSGSGPSLTPEPDVLDGPMIELNDSADAEELPISMPAILNAATGTSVSTTKNLQTSAPKTKQSLMGLANLGALGQPAPAAPATDKVVSIELNPMLTGGDDLDNTPGDEGISVVIEPKNTDGLYVPQAGSVSVVVLDPAKSGTAARVARWDFDIGEATSRLKQSALGRGIHLSLPWPNKPPENEKLMLFVRYTTADQRRLEADQEIHVDLVGKISARWTPAAGGRAGRAVVAPIVADSKPAEAPVASPYAARQQAPLAPTGTSTDDTLENHRINIAQREEEQQPASPPAKKLQRPEWKPFR